MELKVTQHGADVLLDVQVVPRASRSAVVGVHDGRLKVALAAPPVEGAANAALIELLSKQLQVPKRDVKLVRGEASRKKTVAVSGVSVAEVLARLSG